MLAGHEPSGTPDDVVVVDVDELVELDDELVAGSGVDSPSSSLLSSSLFSSSLAEGASVDSSSSLLSSLFSSSLVDGASVVSSSSLLSSLLSSSLVDGASVVSSSSSPSLAVSEIPLPPLRGMQFSVVQEHIISTLRTCHDHILGS